MVRSEKIKIETIDLHVWYRDLHVLKGVNMQIPEKRVTAIIGPSGCGKTTLLKSLNRMVELVEDSKVKGQVLLDGVNIYDDSIDLTELRKRVGMVFQKPNPLPKSIYENIAYGPRIHGINDKKELDKIVEKCLKEAGLWDEVKDRLNDSAFNLSIGQQQRLCIARTLAVNPEVLLMDEPCSALDPRSTMKVEELIEKLRGTYTIVIVTHNMQQAQRISDYTAFIYYGKIVEFGPTEDIFLNPKEKLTRDYIKGKFG
ncbi:phosphate ABC transporter ATP-binding protein [archaeon]|nr:MAG: phosphate ABC transporter ATP-binding protein [archaeon]RLG64974.1 MAG: phosphate ABC transporter ATP-binding protein [archaeon]HDM23673.1 phosphate ABC transporter ATP-binding protein [Candidatus Bathyarchaeota archaeon]